MSIRRFVIKSESSGFIIPAILSFMIALSIITAAVVMLIDSNISLVNRNVKSQEAFNIAEAGINYYLWHLSHSPTDFKDGQSTPAVQDATLGFGPYVHNYYDNNSQSKGTFTLWIKPQGNGSTVAKVRSIGQITGTNIIRTVDAQLGAPSFASYALASDTALWFGNNEGTNGPIHSNIGIRLDGSNNADITSSNATYVPAVANGGNGSTSRAGVWCDTSVTTPVNCNTRDKSLWRYPVPSVDFTQLSGDLCGMKKVAFLNDAATSALAALGTACSQVPATRTNAYIPRTATTFNTSRGYLISLNNNGTYNLARVTGENDTLTPYTAALTTVAVASNIALPTSGVIFVEDNVWVRTNPTFAGRVTIAAGRLATSSNAQANIAGPITYTTKNGTDAIGIIAEGDVTVMPYAPPATGAFNFEVNAALISQGGSVIYPNSYRANGNTARAWTAANQTFTFYGSIASRQTWTWTWCGGTGCGTTVAGIQYNTTDYDYNMLYAPPPSWPITSSYNILSWREVLVTP